MAHPSKKVEAHAMALSLRLEGRSFSEIGRTLGVTQQRAQQITHAPKKIRAAIVERAGGSCEVCGTLVGKSGHIHHRAAQGMTPETYNSEPNLTLLCLSCHRKAHLDPSLAERRRQHQSPEARAARAVLHAYRVGAHRLGIPVDEYRQHREAGERWCSFHRMWEPTDRFGRQAASSDGLARVCREGNRESVRQKQDAAYRRDYYHRNRERLDAYHAAWARQRRQQTQAAS